MFSSGLAWQGTSKKAQSKTRIVNWYWYAINGWKNNIGGISHTIYWYAKANNKYMKDNDKIKESSYLKYWDVNNLHG